MSASVWQWFGEGGHFCGWRQCCFHLHTHVGGYCVSTVGCWHPVDGDRGKPETIGVNRFYETYVFRLEGKHHNDSEIDSLTYQDVDFDKIAAQVNAGHLEMCLKYENLRRAEAELAS